MLPHPSSRLRRLYQEGVERAPLPGKGLICALPIPGSESNRLGRDSSGFACIVLSVPAAHRAARPDVVLQNLRVQRRVTCDVTRPSGEREAITGVVVRCSAESGDLRGFFLDLFDQALESLGAS